METWDTIRARRNVRQYTDQLIARENLERILEAGRRAPSSGNWQPSNFVVVTDREHLIELAKVWDRGGRHIAQSAATIALVAKEPEDETHRDWLMYDFGQATANMMLAAADLGIGSGHSAVFDQDQAQRVLGSPGGYFAVYLIGLGYPADRPLRPIIRPSGGLSTRLCTGVAGSARICPARPTRGAACCGLVQVISERKQRIADVNGIVGCGQARRSVLQRGGSLGAGLDEERDLLGAAHALVAEPSEGSQRPLHGLRPEGGGPAPHRCSAAPGPGVRACCSFWATRPLRSQPPAWHGGRRRRTAGRRGQRCPDRR